jgi:ATP-dependent Clp protease ATP-binding subunit ClpC
MARIVRFPVFLWRSGPDTWSGRVLDDLADGTAVAKSASGVLRQLKDYLRMLDQRDELWRAIPGYADAQLRVVKVSVLPEYPGRKKRSHVVAAITLRLPCVVGKRFSGGVAAELPVMGLGFSLEDEKGLDELASHYVRNHLRGETPAQVARWLPPEECRLEEITLTAKNREDRKEETKLPNLSQVARHAGSADLQRGARTWEREAEVKSLVARLATDRSSLCVTGAHGCGKTSIVLEAARLMERTVKDGGARQPRFWLTSAARLIAGMRWLGEWQERLEKVIAELRSVDGVLCVESLRELTMVGGQGPEGSLAAFLVPYLCSGELRLVAEATPAELSAIDRMMPALVDCFALQRVEPLEEGASDRLLLAASEWIGKSKRLDIQPAAAREAGRLCRRFQPYAAFPGTPVHLLKEAAAAAKELGAATVDSAALHSEYARLSGLPLHLLDDGERVSPDELRAWFQQRLIGQEQAVEAACRALVKFKTGLNDPGRPPAVLLFTGPTGTGKTQLAKLMADWLFPNRPESERMVRLDMSEYAGHDATRRLLGEEHGEPSDLVKRLRQQPFTLLLLDEVEKASPDVFDILMNVFDEGRLTDAHGRETWFRSAFIVLTSNLGVRTTGSLGFGKPALRGSIDVSAVTAFFRPEFFNRMDQMVVFQPLTPEVVEQIAAGELAALAHREGLTTRNIKLAFFPELIRMVAAEGFDPVYGARPLQRRVEELVVAPLSSWLVAHPVARDCVLSFAWRDGVVLERND